jgi:hypothetical protein
MKIFSNDKNELEVKSSPLYQPRSNLTIGNYTFLTQHQYSNELLLQKKINPHQRMLHFTAVKNILENCIENEKTTNDKQQTSVENKIEDEVTNEVAQEEFEDIVILEIERPTKKIEPFANVKIKRDELINGIGEDNYNKFNKAKKIFEIA